MTLGEKLYEARKRQGLTQQELAELSGVSENSISAYERDVVEPSLFKAWYIAEVLKVSLDWLMDREVESFDAKI